MSALPDDLQARLVDRRRERELHVRRIIDAARVRFNLPAATVPKIEVLAHVAQALGDGRSEL